MGAIVKVATLLAPDGRSRPSRLQSWEQATSASDGTRYGCCGSLGRRYSRSSLTGQTTSACLPLSGLRTPLRSIPEKRGTTVVGPVTAHHLGTRTRPGPPPPAGSPTPVPPQHAGPWPRPFPSRGRDPADCQATQSRCPGHGEIEAGVGRLRCRLYAGFCPAISPARAFLGSPRPKETACERWHVL
jgi:hypothetical protein